MLNLREPPPEESAPSSSPSENSREVETVESVRRLLELREPPGLAGIRRFVLKPRPRLWKFGVGIWLWLVQLGEWFLDFLRWLGRGSVRVVKALRLAGFIGRRVQNLGARVGFWGRNWSSAEGRLGRLGAWCVAIAERAVRWGAAIASFTDGAGELTKRAARFIEDVLNGPASAPNRTPDGGGPISAPTPSLASRPETPAASALDPVRAERPPPSAPSPESRPPPTSQPPPAPEPRSARSRRPEAPPKPAPAPVPATPPPLPADIPEYLQIELRAIRQTSRPFPDDVRRLILEITDARGWTRPADLAAWLGFDTNYLKRRHVAPMVKAGLLERRFPKSRDPRQAYRAVRPTGPDASSGA